MRVEEKGNIFRLYLGKVLLRFETSPIWLLSISKDMIKAIVFDQFESFWDLELYFKNSKIDAQLYSSIVRYLGFENFEFGHKGRGTANIFLLSGSTKFLNDHVNML